jgi:hypothetical protein
VLAHAGGIDEIAFVMLPVVVFLLLSWLSRRKQQEGTVRDRSEQENGGSGTNDI